MPLEVGLSERIRFVREELLKWTQPQLQEALGFTRTATISDWERGVSKPRRETLERIAQLAGKSYADLFGPSAAGNADVEREPTPIGSLAAAVLRTMEIEARAAEIEAAAADKRAEAAVIRAQGMRDACRAAVLEAEKAPDRRINSVKEGGGGDAARNLRCDQVTGA